MSSPTPGRPVRTPMCSRCRNHGLLVSVRGHAKNCSWKECTCSKCALISDKQKLMASYRMLRRTSSTGAASPEERSENQTVTRASRRHAFSPSMLSSECMPGLVNYERESIWMYPEYPPLYHYPAFPMAFPTMGFGNPPSPHSPFPMTSIQPYRPLEWRMEQDRAGAGDFRSQGYYPPFPSFMPSTFLPGMHYMPPHVPMSVSMRAEPSMRAELSMDVSAPSSAEE
ncbi:doublesex- and mab-3-related transcription factor B1 [Pyxicephalus adspersus]|uniref:DM domain-containing protein n=1 Tax=Pyxicephalus adspersus TaxID=30357 RepID=A0AAV2ZN73_PYXAD|nr:TPA: hypothetical protein GDO54_016254 [Pyxicephalus adspersus]